MGALEGLLWYERVGTSARDERRAASFCEFENVRADGAVAETRSAGTALGGTCAALSDGLRDCPGAVVGVVPVRGCGEAGT
jgi:hypothetical protein